MEELQNTIYIYVLCIYICIYIYIYIICIYIYIFRERVTERDFLGVSENEEPHLVLCLLLTGKTYDHLCSDNPNWFSIIDVIYGAHFSYSNMGNPGGLFDMIYMGSL